MNLFLVFVSFLLVLILYFFLVFRTSIKVKSTIDNNYYLVQNKKDSQEAADVLASLNQRIEKLIFYLWTKKDNEYKHIQRYIYKLKQKYSYRIISENDSSIYTSYSLNKRYLIFCIRQRDGTDNFVNDDVLTYVALHELSHFVADEIISESEHETNPEFKTLFSSFLKAGEEAKIYNPINFKQSPKPYCGLIIK